MNERPLPFPPDYCDEETMSYLLDMAPSTFREYVSRGILPQGIRIGHRRRWRRREVYEVVEALQNAPAPKGKGDAIMEAFRGKAKEDGSAAA